MEQRREAALEFCMPPLQHTKQTAFLLLHGEVLVEGCREEVCLYYTWSWIWL